MGRYKAVIAFVIGGGGCAGGTSIIYRWVQRKAAAPFATAVKEERKGNKGGPGGS
jgi:hypothetical protein